MRIVSETKDLLITKSQPIGHWISGAVSVIASIYLIILAIRSGEAIVWVLLVAAVLIALWSASQPLITCTLDRKEQSVKLEKRSLFGYDRTKRAFDQINRVVVAAKQTHSGEHSSLTYRIHFETSSERLLPISNAYSWESDHLTYIAEQISRFLKLKGNLPQKRVELERKHHIIRW